jgi:FkbM family methyltransferase
MPYLRTFDYLLLLIALLLYHIKIDIFTHLNIFVEIDHVKYKLIDFESLYILNPYFEPWMRVLKIKNSDVIIDVGAHIGKYALFLAKKRPKCLVIAIEPGRRQFLALIDGIKRNKLNNVVPLNIAAWDKSEKLKLRIYSYSDTSSVFNGLGKGSIINIEVIEAKPLDDVVNELDLKRVDWVKIDVEGAELHVLRGFRNGITRFKPRIVIEIKKFNRREVFKFFEEVDYTCHHIPGDESGEYFICVPKN